MMTNNYVTPSFATLKQQTLEELSLLSDILAKYGFNDRIQAAQERLQREKMHLLVVGEFSRGKSTFINALFGKPLLPSKTNPTTATIGVLEGSLERKMRIVYRDGKIEELDLPQEKVNKYLDQYVSTVNQQANEIKEVWIQYPGYHQDWDCLIVDTPGVNDLDDLREEVTFNFLSKADACIVLLDSQQPLSESERRFLKEKILANDIHRMLFVINRMDEVETEPNGQVTERLKNYIAKLLGEQLPMITTPKIFAVSSKEALRSRFKEEENSWEKSFSHFEKELQMFISQQATMGRMPDHLDRINGITRDGIAALEEKASLLHLSEEDLKQSLQKLQKELDHLNIQMGSLRSLLDKQTTDLTRSIVQFTSKEFTRLQSELAQHAGNCVSDEDIIRLKSRISLGIRDIMEDLSEKVNQFRRDLRSIIQEEYAELYESSQRSLALQNRSLSWQPSSTMELATFSQVAPASSNDFEEVAVGMALGGTAGYLGASLFGPIGIAAALVGTYVLGEKWGEQNRIKMFEEQRQKVLTSIRMQIDQIMNNAEHNAHEVANKELKPIADEYMERMESRVRSIHSTLEEQRKGILYHQQDILTEQERMEVEKQKLKRVIQSLIQLKGEHKI